MRRLTVAAARIVVGLTLTIVAAGTLARLAPGWNTDETAIDSRVTAETVAQRSRARFAHVSTPEFCLQYAAALVGGDLGWSVLFDRPNSELVRDRAWVTLRMVAAGFSIGSLLALCLAGWQAGARSRAGAAFLNLLVAGLLSVPAPILGLLAAILRVPGELAVFFVVLPRMLRYTSSLLAEQARAEFVLAAQCLGIPRARVVLVHMLPVSLPALAAFAGALVPVTLSAAVPIEVAADIPGLGQLAWKATIARDVPLLLSVTLPIAAVSLIANAVSDLTPDRRI
jgi:ABC-type dipeptide/oligopeptide/nickel transport system permease component